MAYDPAEAARSGVMTRVILDMDLDEARRLVRKAGFWLQVIKLDGRRIKGVGDIRSDRILVEAEYGTVVKADVG